MHIWVQVTDVSGTESSAVTNDDLLDVCVLCTKIDKHQQYWSCVLTVQAV